MTAAVGMEEAPTEDQRLHAHAAAHWPQLSEVTVRFRV
jgi:hypothetical protein